MVDPAGHSFLATFEHTTESYGSEMFGCETDTELDESVSGFVVESVEWGVDSPRSEGGDGDAEWLELVIE